jgi:hypothetical protein
MPRALYIDMIGRMKTFYFYDLNMLNQKIPLFNEKYTCVEIHELDNTHYEIYTITDGTRFSRFELDSVNAAGPIVVLEWLNNINEYNNINKQKFLDYYLTRENLDDTIIEDELEEPDEYDFNDPFLVRGEDMLSFIEYLSNHQN